MSSANDIFDFDFKYLFLFVAVVTTAYFFQDKDDPSIFSKSAEKAQTESSSDRVDLGSSTSGKCFNNDVSSDNGTVYINGVGFSTNWRKVLFKECVKKGNKHYLVAKTIGNNAVGYLVYDDIDNSNNTTSYGCVLHNEFKVIKKKPAAFLNVDCSPSGLEKLQ